MHPHPDTTRLPYRNSSLPVETRVQDLLARLSLEEKVAQLTCLWLEKPNDNGDAPVQPMSPTPGRFCPQKAKEKMPDGIGQFARQREMLTPAESAEYANTTQKWLLENTRWGIPAIFHDEILHGNMSSGSTVFPAPIALAASWDPELIRRVFAVAARQTRVRGTHQVLGPNMDLARDPRWGRIEETYGEDPYLAAEMLMPLVATIQQGADSETPLLHPHAVIATGKHFAGHGQPEAGTNIGPVQLSERVLRETHLYPFEKTVKKSGLMSMMPAYHEIDGIPAHANQWLLAELLRGEWGFQGSIVSDYMGVPELHVLHKVAPDMAQAARQALEAGVDVELPDPKAFPTLVEQVRSGAVDMVLIDQAVARVLRHKFQLGLFENPWVDPAAATRQVDTDEDRELAATAARRSIVLLKNEGHLLPLDRRTLRSLAVIGPNAEKAHLGGYTDPQPPRTVSLLEGIRRKVGDQIEVRHAKGCVITKEDGNWFADTSTPGDEETDRLLIGEAVQVAASCDAVILCLGGNEDTNKEAWAAGHLGDRDSIELFGRQNELVSALVATGKPIVAFLTNGGPLAINQVAAQVPAILEGFYLGEETGTAAADVIFGDENPGGKLPVTFPRSVGQIPAGYAMKPTARRGYVFADKEPLFPFGHGLSYTTFAYGSPRLEQDSIPVGGSTIVSIDVTNTGPRAGDEVVQFYLRDDYSSVTRPVRELRGFQRLHLQPGESRTVSFPVTPESLQFYDRNMQRVVEPGTFTLLLGGDPMALQSTILTVTG